MFPTLPRGLKPGAPVWGVMHFGGGWIPALLGKVKRVTKEGYEVHGKHGRLLGFTETPLFVSHEAARTWADENPPNAPTAPGAFGNVK